MAKCFLCGAASAGPTCDACQKAAPGAAPPRRTLDEALGGMRKGPRATTPAIPPEERTGFEADTAEVGNLPERTAPVLEPLAAGERTDEVPLEIVEIACAEEVRADLDQAFAAFEAGTSPPSTVPPQGSAPPSTGSILSEADTSEVVPLRFVAEAQAAADAAVPPASPPAQIERWNTILDESPVFVGHRFEVQTPPTPAPGTLDVAIETRFDVASAPADAEPVVHLLVTLSPHGAPLMAGREGPVAHVVLALDLSASMDDPAKYPLLRRALHEMFRDLRSKFAHEVLVSIVAFAYGAETLVHAVPSSQIDADAVLGKLDNWDRRFTRYTDLVGALHRAGRIARDSVAANKAMPVRIYVLTDGKPQDMAGARAVTSLIAKLPVDVHGLAFGDDADVASLGSLFAGGRGGTVKQVRADTIRDAFGRLGDVAQLVVANRALLDVELHGGATGGEAYRYRPARWRYPQGAFTRGTHFSADLGTLESGRTYSLLFKLRLRRAKGTETDVARVALRVPGFGGPRLFETLVSLPRHPGRESAPKDADVQSAIDVVTALGGDDPQATLRALRIRRELYTRERRDPHVVAVLDKAIRELESNGHLHALSPAEHATLVSHTLTTRVRRDDLPALRAAILAKKEAARPAEVPAPAGAAPEAPGQGA